MKKLIQLALALLWLSSCKVAELQYMDHLGRQVVLHTDSSLVRASLQKEGLLVLPKMDYTYYWFEKGKIGRSQAAYSGKVLHGQYRRYDRDSKQLLESGKFNKGLKSGRWLIWNSTGLLNRSEIYKEGQLDGMLIKYDSLGKAADTLNYRRGMLLAEKLKKPGDTTSLFRRLKGFLKFRK